MQFKDLSRILAVFVFVFSATLLFPLLVDGYYKFFVDAALHPQPYAFEAFIGSIAICLLLALVFKYFGRNSTRKLYQHEGIAAVVFIWLLIPALASLPFLLSGTLKNPFQAYFEMTSGFTTTGASVLVAKNFDPLTGKEIPIQRSFCGDPQIQYSFYGNIDPVRDPATNQIVYEGIEAVGKGLLFWRSFTQWLGGVGIVVLFIAILPALGAGGRILFQAEVPGPMKDSMTPRIKEAAVQLWKIYLGLTISQVILLMATNPSISLFDATTISFSTLSTGGFSVKNTSIEYYHNNMTEWITILFMILGGINFTLYFYILRGKFYRIYEPEFFTYLLVIAIGTLIAVWKLVGTPNELITGEFIGKFDLESALRSGMFQVVSAQTSTGFISTNYDHWPYAVQTLMLIYMFVGGMSGSTAGGIKVMRHYMLVKLAQSKIESLFQPRRIKAFQVADKEVDESSSSMVFCFFFLVIALSVLGTFVYILDNIDPQTALGAVACMVNNVGLGFQMGGPTGTFAFMSDASLLWSSFLMIAGRLEFFVVLAVFSPAFWMER